MPRPPTTPPTVKQRDDRSETVKTHPAFGMLRFGRISGSSGRLFGSEINHQSFIRLELTPGQEIWRHSESRYYGPLKTLLEVDLSAAQFAELISSFSVGSGVPCTIRYLDGREIEHIAEEKGDTFHERVTNDIQEKTEAIGETVKTLRATLADTLAASKLPKVKQAELNDLMSRIEMELASNLPFILSQYQEGAEKIGAKAKVELDAFAAHVITALGRKALDALNEGDKPVEIARQ